VKPGAFGSISLAERCRKREAFVVAFEDLEREWNQRKRGRRKERLVAATAVALFLVLIAVGVFYFAG
jgi:hypothetical protein